jgi:hypothetical protein
MSAMKFPKKSREYKNIEQKIYDFSHNNIFMAINAKDDKLRYERAVVVAAFRKFIISQDLTRAIENKQQNLSTLQPFNTIENLYFSCCSLVHK